MYQIKTEYLLVFLDETIPPFVNTNPMATYLSMLVSCYIVTFIIFYSFPASIYDSGKYYSTCKCMAGTELTLVSVAPTLGLDE